MGSSSDEDFEHEAIKAITYGGRGVEKRQYHDEEGVIEGRCRRGVHYLNPLQGPKPGKSMFNFPFLALLFQIAQPQACFKPTDNITDPVGSATTSGS